MGLPFSLILFFIFGYFLLGKALPAAAVLYYLRAADPVDDVLRASLRSINEPLKNGMSRVNLADKLLTGDTFSDRLPRDDSFLGGSPIVSQEVNDLQAYLASTRQTNSGSDGNPDDDSPRFLREHRNSQSIGVPHGVPEYYPPSRKITR